MAQKSSPRWPTLPGTYAFSPTTGRHPPFLVELYIKEVVPKRAERKKVERQRRKYVLQAAYSDEGGVPQASPTIQLTNAGASFELDFDRLSAKSTPRQLTAG
jgi:hypothetical protein